MRPRRLARIALLGLVTLGMALALLALFKTQFEGALSLPLINALRSGDAGERREAAAELGLMRQRGEGGSRAIPALIERLEDSDPEVRQAAAEALSHFEGEAAPALPVLPRVLREGPAALRASAVYLLGVIDSPEAYQILAETLADPDAEVRREVVQGFMLPRPAAIRYVPRMLEMLKTDPDSGVREAALDRLAGLVWDEKEAAQYLILALRDGHESIRRKAVVLLRSQDPLPHLRELLTALRDPDAVVRNEAILGLGRIGLRHPSAVAGVCEALASPETRDAARGAISRMVWVPSSISPSSPDTSLARSVDTLVKAMECGDSRTAGVIASRLCRLIAEAAWANPQVPEPLLSTVPRIVARLRARDPVLRRYLIVTLLQQDANEALMPLVAELADGVGNGTEAGATNLKEWKIALAALANQAHDRNPSLRSKPISTMLADDLIAALMPEICQGLNDEDGTLQIWTQLLLFSPLPKPSGLIHDHRSSIASSSTARRSIVTALATALNDRSPGRRSWAADALLELGPLAVDSQPVLREAISREQDGAAREHMEAALRRVGEAAVGEH